MTRRTFILTVFLVTLFAGLASACPMCKDSIPNSDVGSAVAVPSGFNFSVYYMLTGLFATLGLISFVVFKGVRDANRYSVQKQQTIKPTV